MRQLITIAQNAFMELIRQPVYLLLLTCSSGFGIFLAIVPYFGFGDDPKLVKDSVLAVLLLAGLFCAVLSASSSVAWEIRTGTALAVLSKPVSRAQFLLAKYLGVAAALVVLTYVNLLSSLLASRMAFDAYGDADMFAFWTFFGAVAAAYVLGGFTNYFLRRPFVSDAVFFLGALVTLAFVVINFFDQHLEAHAWATGVDWRLVRAAVLILWALWVLAGVALACSTRLDVMPTLAICSAVFLLGLMSDYMFGRPADQGRWWASVLYGVTPNWQLFWLSDALEGQKTIPWSYVGKAFGYASAYLGAVLAVALALFQDRELS